MDDEDDEHEEKTNDSTMLNNIITNEISNTGGIKDNENENTSLYYLEKILEKGIKVGVENFDQTLCRLGSMVRDGAAYYQGGELGEGAWAAECQHKAMGGDPEVEPTEQDESWFIMAHCSLHELPLTLKLNDVNRDDEIPDIIAGIKLLLAANRC